MGGQGAPLARALPAAELIGTLISNGNIFWFPAWLAKQQDRQQEDKQDVHVIT
jgi:hypothetical protein